MKFNSLKSGKTRDDKILGNVKEGGEEGGESFPKNLVPLQTFNLSVQLTI